MPTAKLILASSSPYRRTLLGQLMVPFEVDAPEIDESPRPGESAIELVERLAVTKAQAVARRHPDAVVIGADQVADHDGTIVGKPRDHADAVRQLETASGQRITLYTGLAVTNAARGTTQRDVVPYTVVFRHLDRGTIERYLAREAPYGCSGSLRADGLGVALLERFSGDDPSALIGLPLIRLVRMLEAEGIAVV